MCTCKSSLITFTNFNNNKMGCFNDPAWKVCGWWSGGVVVVGWLTPTPYIQLAGAGSKILSHKTIAA